MAQVRVSPEVRGILDDAAELSMRRGQYYVGVEHLFEILLNSAGHLPEPLVSRHGSVLEAASRECLSDLWQGRLPAMVHEAFFTPRCTAVTNQAAKLAQRLAAGPPQGGHVLLAILSDAHSAPSRALDRLGHDRGAIIDALWQQLAQPGRRPRSDSAPTPPPSAPEERTAVPATDTVEPGSKDDAARPALAQMTVDLSELARAGRLEPAIGRDKELHAVLEILARRAKNNVILVGEAGVGKTRFMEGLALLAAKGGADLLSRRTRILELNLAAFMAGTQYRGALESRLMALIDELKADKHTILFIDEIHLIMGAGAADGDSMDLANLLKPALSRGEIRCIGATTLKEYRRFIERDPAIERRFQMVRLEPLSEAATWEVLTRLRPALEEHHGVRVGRRTMHAAIALTVRYMPNRHLPDKAIDVLDQACARYRLKLLRAKRKAKQDGLAFAPRTMKVTPHEVRKVVSQITSVPVEEITAEERRQLGNLKERLMEWIAGQDEAVARVTASVMKARAGLSDPNRPEASFLFLGPTGVGKTELAKALAATLFGSDAHLISFDMSEFVEAHAVSRLLGAPPGYVGSEEEGRLTSAVRDKPFSILLFDEIEKAHPRIFDVFLPILDEGRLKDQRGREVSFKNCILIFTSNTGAELIQRDPTESGERHLSEALRSQFRPEFINRIDDIVPFYPLMFEDIRRILEGMIKQLRRRLQEKAIDLHVYQGAYEWLAERGYNAEYGARELRRTVDREVVNPISERVVQEGFKAGDTIEVLVEDGALIVRKGTGRQAGPTS